MPSELDVFPRAMSLAVHELRTPITVASGYLRMLLREQAGPLDEKQRKMVEEADRSCARIGAIIAEMSELGKLEAREIAVASATFDLAALVTELASNMQGDEDRGVTLEARASHPVIVAGDRTRLSAALTALMHAAVRERGEPGAIVVECSTLNEGGHTWAVVTIGDDTLTPSLREQARTGTTMFEFDEWRGGLGLALPVGRRVIEAHGGAIWSAPEPAPRAGSVFRLPAAVPVTSA